MFVERNRTPAPVALSFAAALVFASSCQAPPSHEATEPAAQIDNSTGTTIDSEAAPTAATERTTTSGAAGTQNPQNPQNQESLKAQRERFLAKKYLEDARQLQADGKLEEARLLLLRAKELTPADQNVLQALASVTAQINPSSPSTGATYADQMTRMWKIREARAKADAEDRLQSAQKATDAKKFDEAIQLYRNVLERIKAGPDINWGDLQARTEKLLAEAQKASDAYVGEKQAAVERQIMQVQRKQMEEQQARTKARVDSFLDKAIRAFDNAKYELAQDLSFQALDLDPTNALARDLNNAATKALRESHSTRYIDQKRHAYIHFLEAKQELKIPQFDILQVDPVTWKQATERRSSALPEWNEDPDDKAVREAINSKMISGVQFTEETGDYNDVIKLLRTMSGIPIIVTPEARETISSESLVMQIDVNAPVSLANFLDLMVSKSEALAWTVRKGVVELTTKAKAGGQNVMIAHDVRDLVFPRTTFIPPVIRDIPSGDAGIGGPRIGAEGDEKVAFIEPDTLQINIRAATGGDAYWDAEGGGTMDYVESGYLLVNASPEGHKRVERFLEDQRRFATSVVTVETKFLTITQNFLQELGVDFRGLGGSGAKGTEATLDDITNALDDNASRGLDNQGTGDAASHPAAGAFFNDGGDGDIRARTENFFGSPLGQALSTNGGATAAITILDDTQLQILVTAIQKQQDVQVVNSQLLTVLNNERANMAVINQTSYVRDFDVEVAQASFIADPKVDVIQDGIVLDVRPTIAHDRKHVTLSLQPTVAELMQPIPTFTTSLAGTTLPVTLQLPTLTVRSFATTASVPDGGSVLIGGLREVLSKERRAEIPILAKIPIVSFLFKQEGVADENSSLAVLVSATINDMTEFSSASR